MKYLFSTSLFKATTAAAVMALFAYTSKGQTIIPIDEEPPMINFTFLGPDSAGLAFAPNSPVLIRWAGTKPNQRIQVKFSANDGRNFNYLLASGIPVAAQQVWVVLPNINTNLGRFQVRATATGDSTRTDVSSNPVVLSSSLICKPAEMFANDGFVSKVRILNSAGSPLLSNQSTSFWTSGFVDYSGNLPVPNLTRSSSTSTTSFTMEVTTAGVLSGQPKSVGIWIDYNGDNQFASTGPEFLGTFSATTGTVFRRTFSIPSSVSAGFKRVRVRLVQNTIYSLKGNSACLVRFPALSPTSTTSAGETEDYAINVVAPIISARMSTEEAQPEWTKPESRLYPNPVQHDQRLFLFLTGFGKDATRFTVSDLSGKVIENQLISENQTLVPIKATLSKGMYVVTVIGASQRQVHKLIVE